MRTVIHNLAQSVVNKVESGSGMGFDRSLNPYRGCAHGCKYCYARATHEYFDLSVAEDFENVLFVKDNLADRLVKDLNKIPLDDTIAIGTATDPYQSVEGRYRLTRSAIKKLSQSGHAFTITTKSPLILKDIDLLGPLAKRGQCQVNVSLISLDRMLVRQLEPGTASPQKRLSLMQSLISAGIPTALFVAPIIPGLTDDEDTLDALFAEASRIGVSRVMSAPLRLADPIKKYFYDQLDKFFPQHLSHIRTLYDDRSTLNRSRQFQINATLTRLYDKYSCISRWPAPKPYRPVAQIDLFSP